MTSARVLLELLLKAQNEEDYDYCDHGLVPRPTRDPGEADKLGLTIEHWFEEHQPDYRYEYWLHVCNIANPNLALDIYKKSLLYYLSQFTSSKFKLLIKYARDEMSKDDVIYTYETLIKKKVLERYEDLMLQTCRWELNMDESRSPLFCIPLLCRVRMMELRKRRIRQPYLVVLRDLWKWWKTQVTPEEWSDGIK